jgi:hypothetical protein
MSRRNGALVVGVDAAVAALGHARRCGAVAKT